MTENGGGSPNICLSCGLCCNGVIFSDVKLLPGEDAAGLRVQGIPLARCAKEHSEADGSAVSGWRFTQPCTAFDGCRCGIYSSRPKYCREFDCLLLKKVHAGSVTQEKALTAIRSARRQAEKVRKLLRELGDEEESLALSERFRRIAKSMKKGKLDTQAAELYGRLTVAFHELSVTLQNSFYPG